LFNTNTLEVQQTQNLAFQTEPIEIQEVPNPKVTCGAKVHHINSITGGTLFTSVPKDYDGPCAVLDISIPSKQETLAVLPSNKEARMLAFVALTPDGGYSEVLIEATDIPVTHQSFADWL